jgi:hypothetical protein
VSTFVFDKRLGPLASDRGLPYSGFCRTGLENSDDVLLHLRFGPAANFGRPGSSRQVPCLVPVVLQVIQLDEGRRLRAHLRAISPSVDQPPTLGAVSKHWPRTAVGGQAFMNECRSPISLSLTQARENGISKQTTAAGRFVCQQQRMSAGPKVPPMRPLLIGASSTGCQCAASYGCRVS